MFKTLTPIFSILIAIGLFFLVARPILGEIQAVQDETSEYREAVAKASEFNTMLENLLNQKNSFSALELERLQALVPDEVNEMKMLVDIEALAKKYNMLFGNVKVEETGNIGGEESPVGSGGISVEKDFDPTTISFSVIGTYEDYRQFLSELEKSLTLIEIAKISFETTTGDLQQYDFSIRAYALKAVEE